MHLPPEMRLKLWQGTSVQSGILKKSRYNIASSIHIIDNNWSCDCHRNVLPIIQSITRMNTAEAITAGCHHHKVCYVKPNFNYDILKHKHNSDCKNAHKHCSRASTYVIVKTSFYFATSMAKF